MIKLRLFWFLVILCVSIIGSFIFFFGFDYSSKNSSVKKTLQQKPQVPVELGLVRKMEIKEKLKFSVSLQQIKNEKNHAESYI